MDRLVGGLFETMAQSRKLEARLKESETTSRAKYEALYTEIERREKAHQQAISTLATERDLARALQQRRKEEAVASEHEAAQLTRKV